MNVEKYKEDLKREVSKKKSEGYQFIPIISGATSLYFLQRIIFSNLPYDKFILAIGAVLIVFGISAFLFWSLKRAEQDKDKYLLSTVGKIVEDVFKHYGVSMASNAAGPTTANQMNPIMLTIVDLVSGLKELMQKSYTKN
ncbi:MAG: hypothetical protein HYV37_01575 [Candidatus Levyibacteriota bacterium]|nr:MAG: hypothetical protein HYV37_01575 [Candidatus Levybacteria bacterium]